MADITQSAPADASGASDETLDSLVNDLPMSSFGVGFGNDDEKPQAKPAARAAQPQADAEPADEPEPTPRARAADGRFAPRQDAQAEAEPQEADAGAEQPQDGQEQLAEGDPPEQDAAAPDGPEKAKAEGKRLDFIEIDGSRYTAEDVRRGFLREGDYTRKTQELGQARQALQGQTQQLQQYEQQLAGVLEIAVTALRDTLPPQPDAAMLDQDIVGYHKQMAAHNAAVERLRAIAQLHEQQGQRSRSQQQLTAEQQEALTHQRLQQEFALMQEKIPELRTPEGRDTFFREAQTHGAHYGLSVQDIAQIQDHRALAVLKDAIAYRKLQAAKPQTVERIKAAPPIQPAARPGAGTRQGQAKREANRQFLENPTIDTLIGTGVFDSLPRI